MKYRSLEKVLLALILSMLCMTLRAKPHKCYGLAIAAGQSYGPY